MGVSRFPSTLDTSNYLHAISRYKCTCCVTFMIWITGLYKSLLIE